MTTDTDPATVAVPVELLKELIEIVRFHKGSTPAGRQATALLPRPKPRLVAVDLDYWADFESVNFKRLAEQPDLLTLLDEAIDGSRYLPNVCAYFKARIRAALGVTE